MMNLSVSKSTSRLNPLLPGFLFKYRSSLLKDLKTSFLSGAEALDASLVKKGPNIFFKNFFKVQVESYCSIPPFATELSGKNLLNKGIFRSSFLSIVIINHK